MQVQFKTYPFHEIQKIGPLINEEELECRSPQIVSPEMNFTEKTQFYVKAPISLRIICDVNNIQNILYK